LLNTLFSYRDIPEKRIQSAFTHIAATRRTLLQRLSSEGLLKNMYLSGSTWIESENQISLESLNRFYDWIMNGTAKE
jgi:hypothetical protein